MIAIRTLERSTRVNPLSYKCSLPTSFWVKPGKLSCQKREMFVIGKADQSHRDALPNVRELLRGFRFVGFPAVRNIIVASLTVASLTKDILEAVADPAQEHVGGRSDLLFRQLVTVLVLRYRGRQIPTKSSSWPRPASPCVGCVSGQVAAWPVPDWTPSLGS